MTNEELEFEVQRMLRLRIRFEEIRAMLAVFYRAPFSMSSVQPILDLAVELNPELKPE